MLAFLRFLYTRFARPPRAEHPHITALVCFGAALLTVVLVTMALEHFAPK